MKRILACLQNFLDCLREAIRLWRNDEDELEEIGERYGL